MDFHGTLQDANNMSGTSKTAVFRGRLAALGRLSESLKTLRLIPDYEEKRSNFTNGDAIMSKVLAVEE